MGPFDDLTETHRQQIREAHAANKEREIREALLPRLACTECDWHGNDTPGVKCPDCGSYTCPCQCAEVEEIVRAAERTAKKILAAQDRANN